MFTRFTLFILTLYSVHSAGQGFDYGLSVPFRSYPLAGGLVAQGGYNVLLWGEKKPDSPLGYAYARPGLTLASSTRTHSYDAFLQVFLIPTTSLEWGIGESARFGNPYFVDCSIYQCQGNVKRNYFKLTGALGLPRFFLAYSLKWTRLSSGDAAFVDEYSNLVAHRGGDQLTTGDLALVYKIDSNWMAAIVRTDERMYDAATTSRLTGLAARYQLSPWVFGLGIGMYESSTASNGLTVFGGVKWVGQPSMAPD